MVRNRKDTQTLAVSSRGDGRANNPEDRNKIPNDSGPTKIRRRTAGRQCRYLRSDARAEWDGAQTEGELAS